MPLPTVTDVYEARRRLGTRLPRTPLLPSAWLSSIARRQRVPQDRVAQPHQLVQDSRRLERRAAAAARASTATPDDRRRVRRQSRPRARTRRRGARHGVRDLHAGQRAGGQAEGHSPAWRRAALRLRGLRRRRTAGQGVCRRPRAASTSRPTTMPTSLPAPAPSAWRSSSGCRRSTSWWCRSAAAGWQAASAWRSRQPRRRPRLSASKSRPPRHSRRASTPAASPGSRRGPSLADGLVGNLEPGAITFPLVQQVVDYGRDGQRRRSCAGDERPGHRGTTDRRRRRRRGGRGDHRRQGRQLQGSGSSPW